MVITQFLKPPQTDKNVGIRAIIRPNIISTILIFFIVSSITKLTNSSNAQMCLSGILKGFL